MTAKFSGPNSTRARARPLQHGVIPASKPPRLAHAYIIHVLIFVEVSSFLASGHPLANRTACLCSTLSAVAMAHQASHLKTLLHHFPLGFLCDVSCEHEHHIPNTVFFKDVPHRHLSLGFEIEILFLLCRQSTKA
jgi:hypothetical protein